MSTAKKAVKKKAVDVIDLVSDSEDDASTSSSKGKEKEKKKKPKPSGKEDKPSGKDDKPKPSGKDEKKTYWNNYEKVMTAKKAEEYYDLLAAKVKETVGVGPLFERKKSKDPEQRKKRELELKEDGKIQPRVHVLGKEGTQWRRVMYFSRHDQAFKYSGAQQKVNPWLPVLDELAAIASQYAHGEVFDSALVNWYRNGDDHVGAHRDKDSMHTHIASFSLYEHGTKPANLQKMIITNDPLQNFQVPEQKHVLVLSQGSLLIMNPGMQHRFKHAIPRRDNDKETKKVVTTGRINVTFRQHQKEAEIKEKQKKQKNKKQKTKHGGSSTNKDGVRHSSRSSLRHVFFSTSGGCGSRVHCPTCLNYPRMSSSTPRTGDG